MQHTVSNWQSRDNLKLYAQEWRPEGDIRAVVSLVHGLGEHSGRYAHVAQAFTDAGFALLAFDLRGHGRSGGPRGHSPGYEALMEDVAVLLEQAEARFPARPRFLYGHSLGGNIVLNYALRRQPPIAGVIATSPALGLAFEPPAWKLAVGRLLYRAAPQLQLSNGLDLQGLSRDAEVISTYQNDPLVHDRISSRLALDMLEAGRWALEHAGEFPLPLLLLHGGSDPLVLPGACVRFAQRAGYACTPHQWPELLHEIHNEPEQGEVFATMIEWMDGILKGK